MSLVSIIIPVYNAEKFIDKTIKSVINQTHFNWELILIDDGSTDRSFELISRYKEEKRINIIKNDRNLGVIKTRNKGIKIAKGKFIAFLDADDLWKPEKLKMQIEFMEINNLSISFTEYEKINENGILRGKLKLPNKIDYNLLLKSNFMGCLTVIYDQEILGKKFFREIDKSEDYVLWLEIIKEVKEIKCLNYNLASYRVMEKSRSSNKFYAVYYQWIIYRTIERLSFCKSLYCFIIYLFYGYKRFKV